MKIITQELNNQNSRIPEKTERNIDLYKDSKKMKPWELSAKYHITTTRVYKIIASMKKKEAHA